MLRHLQKLIWRDKRLVLFTPTQDAFTGNCKYIHLQMRKRFPEKRLVWIVYFLTQRKALKALGVESYCYEKDRWKIPWLRFRVGYQISDGAFNDKISYAGRNPVYALDFWHGFPIKHISPISRDFALLILKMHKEHPNYNLHISHSSYAARRVLSAYHLPEELGRVLGAPKIEPLLMEPEELDAFIAEHCGQEEQRLSALMAKFDKVYFYLPTYRDDQIDFLKLLHLDMARLSQALKAQRALFIFKTHPLSNLNYDAHSYHNIVSTNQRIDIYPIMARSHCIISDYSSTYVDAMWRKDKQVIMLHGDVEAYRRGRALNEENFQDFVDHAFILQDFPDLVSFIEGEIPYRPLPQSFIDKYWDPKVLENPHGYLELLK